MCDKSLEGGEKGICRQFRDKLYMHCFGGKTDVDAGVRFGDGRLARVTTFAGERSGKVQTNG